MTDNIVNSKWRGRISRYAPLVLWIGVIFVLSTGQASMSETSRIIRPVLEFLFPSAPEETILFYLVGIRKSAHVAEYAVLAFLASRAFRRSSIKILQRFWFVSALVLVILIASIDEYGQSLRPERTGSIYDVLIDIFGGLAALIGTWTLSARRR